LRKSQILSAEQLEEIERDLQPRHPDAKALARALIERGWITAYQVNQLSQGKGKDLMLGQYLILERLGEGGMGQVFKARHSTMGRVVALKVLRKERLANPDALRRFHREIQAAARLSHPNVVLAYDADAYNNTHFFVMEYVDGIDLARLVRKSGPMPINKACNCIYQAALGLAHAHEHGLTHRDIKPHNLLLNRDGTVKILDMGLVRLGHAESDSEVSALTQDGKVVGTPDYIAPEQARNSHAADIRSDLYSLGCTLYFLLSGKVPFPGGGSLIEKLMRHQTEDPVPLRLVRPDIPAAVGAIVHKLMQRKPEQRYQTPEELAAALEPYAFEDGGGTPATEISVSKPSQPIIEISPTMALPADSGVEKHGGKLWVTAVAAAVLAAAGVVLGIVIVLANRPQTQVQKRDTQPDGAPDPGKSAQGNPLDRLKAEDIPVGKRPAQPMPGLVAVLGEPRGQHWGAGGVIRPTYSPDGKLLASFGGFGDSYVRIWDPKTLRERAHLNAGGGVLNYTFSADSRQLAAVTFDGQFRVWDLSPASFGKKLNEYKLSNQTGVAFSADGQMAAGVTFDQDVKKPKILKIWEVRSGNVRRTIEIPEGFVFHVGFAPNGRRLLAVVNTTVDNKPAPTIKLWDVDGNTVKAFQGFEFVQGQPQFTPDSSAVVVLDNTKARIYDCKAGTVLQSFPVANGFFPALSPDGKVLAILTRLAGNRKASILLWDMEHGKKLPALENLDPGPGAARFTPDSRLLLAFPPFDGPVHIWETGNFKEVPGFKESLGMVHFAGFSADSRQMAVGTQNSALRVWDLPSRREIVPLPGRTGPIVFAALADERTFLTGNYLPEKAATHFVRRWDVVAQTEQVIAREINTGIWAYDPVQRVVAGTRMTSAPGGTSSVVRLFDADTGADRVTFPPEPNSFVLGLAFTPDGKALATAVWTGDNNNRQSFIVLRDVADGRELMRLPERLEQIHLLNFSPDGQLLAMLSRAGYLKVWDVTTRQEHSLPNTPGINTHVGAVAFSPDNSLLALGNGYYPDNRVFLRLFDLKSGKAGRTFAASAPVGALAFRPDGKVLAAFDSAGNLNLFDVAGGQSLRHWTIGGPVHSLHFSKDGRYLFTANGNGTVYVLRLEEPAT
jgi:serine/threonine-protein kinase